jgi:hypothetical protein
MGNENVKLIGRPKIGLQLRESDDEGEFTTMDVLAGLCGVCQALDEVAGNCDDANVTHRLSIAAKVLCSILDERVITP